MIPTVLSRYDGTTPPLKALKRQSRNGGSNVATDDAPSRADDVTE